MKPLVIPALRCYLSTHDSAQISTLLFVKSPLVDQAIKGLLIYDPFKKPKFRVRIADLPIHAYFYLNTGKYQKHDTGSCYSVSQQRYISMDPHLIVQPENASAAFYSFEKTLEELVSDTKDAPIPYSNPGN